MTKLNDPITKAFVDFFNDQGIKFVDIETGEEISPVDPPAKKCHICDNYIPVKATKCNWCQNKVKNAD